MKERNEDFTKPLTEWMCRWPFWPGSQYALLHSCLVFTQYFDEIVFWQLNTEPLFLTNSFVNEWMVRQNYWASAGVGFSHEKQLKLTMAMQGLLTNSIVQDARWVVICRLLTILFYWLWYLIFGEMQILGNNLWHWKELLYCGGNIDSSRKRKSNIAGGRHIARNGIERNSDDTQI